jgi:hypothetical protein
MGNSGLTKQKSQRMTQVLRATFLAQKFSKVSLYEKSMETIRKCFQGEDQSHTFRYALGIYSDNVSLERHFFNFNFYLTATCLEY